MLPLDKETQHAARIVLRAWNLHGALPQFLASADGLAIVAHLCNAGAKRIDDSLYAYKPLLVRVAAEAHPFAFARDGIVYIETPVGQVSFHIFHGEDALLPRAEAEHRPWAGGWMQDIAYDMATAFLYGDDDVGSFERLLAERQTRTNDDWID